MPGANSADSPGWHSKVVGTVDLMCRWFLYLTIASLLVALLGLTLNVIFRLILTSLSGWIVDIVQGDSVYQFARAAVVIIIFGGLPEVTKRGSHIRIEILPDRAPARWTARLDMFNRVVTMAILAGFTWACADYALAARRLNSTLGSNPPWPVWPIAIFMVVGLALSVLVLFTQIVAPATVADESDGGDVVAPGDEAL